MERIVLSWSGGKDAAIALGELLADPEFEVVELLTTINADRDRSTMHGVRRELYDRQADALGLPIRYVDIPEDAGNEVYETRMAEAMADYESAGIDRIAFADLHLEDVRSYREDRLSGTGLEGTWPIWGRDTRALVNELLDSGFRATVVCVDDDALSPDFVGRELDESLVEALPDGVDPCGENGEFHTFVHDGPIFDYPVAVRTGDTVSRTIDGATFHYVDLLGTERGTSA